MYGTAIRKNIAESRCDSPGVQVDEQEIKNVKASAMERELNELELLL